MIMNNGSHEESNRDIMLQHDDVITAGNNGAPLHVCVEVNMNLLKVLHDTYYKNSMFAKIMEHPEAHPRFGIWDGLLG